MFFEVFFSKQDSCKSLSDLKKSKLVQKASSLVHQLVCSYKSKKLFLLLHWRIYECCGALQFNNLNACSLKQAIPILLSQISGKTVQVRLKSESLLSKTDLTVQNLVSHGSSFTGDSEEHRNFKFTPVRGRALSDLLSSSSEKQSVDVPVLEPIRIHSTEALDDENSESEPEDDGNHAVNYDSDNDSEPEADPEMKKITNEGCGK